MKQKRPDELGTASGLKVKRLEGLFTSDYIK